LSKVPLFIGCDITNMSEETFEILTNEEFILIFLKLKSRFFGSSREKTRK